MSQSQGNQVSEVQNNFNQLRNGFLGGQPCRTETDEQTQIIGYQRKKPNKEWIDKSIQDGSIHCYPKSDIDVGRPIAGGAFGVVYKATMKRKKLTVATKTLYRDVHGNEEKFYRKLAKEVSH